MKIYRTSTGKAYFVKEPNTPTTDEEIEQWIPIVPQLFTDWEDLEQLLATVEQFLNIYAVDGTLVDKLPEKLYTRLGQMIVHNWIKDKYK